MAHSPERRILVRLVAGKSRLTLFHTGAEDGSWGTHAIQPLEIITKGIERILLANLSGR